jgi:hypothetical protein
MLANISFNFQQNNIETLISNMLITLQKVKKMMIFIYIFLKNKLHLREF